MTDKVRAAVQARHDEAQKELMAYSPLEVFGRARDLSCEIQTLGWVLGLMDEVGNE